MAAKFAAMPRVSFPMLLLSLVAGALAVAGFAPLSIWPLPVLSLAVLFALLARTASGRAGFLIGLAWGLGFFIAGVSWVFVSLSVYGGMAAWLAALATLLFCTFLALFPAAVGALQARWPVSPALRLLVLTPLAWGMTEWVRGWIFTGFPWLVMGYSQVPSSPLAGYAPLVGVYGVSFLLALVAALLAWTMTAHGRPAQRAWVVVAVVALGVGGQVLRGIAWTTPDGAPTSVALLQGNIPQDMKWQPEKTLATLESYARMAAASPAQLIVLPETALPLFESDLPGVYREGLVVTRPKKRRRRADRPADRIAAGRLLQQRHQLRQRAQPALSQGAPGAVRRIHPAEGRVGLGDRRAAHSRCRILRAAPSTSSHWPSAASGWLRTSATRMPSARKSSASCRRRACW